jgi:selenocysteine-specific elongation factor
VERAGAALRLASHAPRLSEQDEALWSQLAPILMESGLRPPRVRELAALLDRAPDAMERALMRFEAFGLVLRVAPNRFFPPETVACLAVIAGTLAAAAEEGGFPAGQFAIETGIGRNLAIQVLEFLDRMGVTKRVGELRHVVRSVDDALG